MACGKGWKTGIDALEDVGNIAWHRCTSYNLGDDGSRVGETCSMNSLLGVSQTTQNAHQVVLQCNCVLFNLYVSH